MRHLVRDGYDAISTRYRDDRGRSHPSGDESTAPYGDWVRELGLGLRPGDRVLDLGCGAGVPASALLAEAGFRVTGLDISGVQVRRARGLVPQGSFIEADMATWDSEPGSYEAVVSLYALIHVPIEDQRRLIPRIARWLVPGGYLLAITGSDAWTGVADYLGAPMFWDHADTDTYLTWLGDAGLQPSWHRVIPEGTSRHSLILARKEGGS